MLGKLGKWHANCWRNVYYGVYIWVQDQYANIIFIRHGFFNWTSGDKQQGQFAKGRLNPNELK